MLAGIFKKRFRGFVDKIDIAGLSGWAQDRRSPNAPISVRILVDGKAVSTVISDRYRADLSGAGIGDGNHGFEFEWPKGQYPKRGSTVSVEFEGNGKPLRNSPLDPYSSFNFPSFDDLSENLDSGDLPPTDVRSDSSDSLTPLQRQWQQDGFLWLNDFIPHDLLDEYLKVRWEMRPSLKTWKCPVPYMHVPAIRDLCLYRPLSDKLEELIGTKMALNLNLTGLRSTERCWHQDDYLNPSTVQSWYIAAWIALDDIPEDCGPFEFVPGSNRWPLLRREKVLQYLPPEYREKSSWPVTSECYVDSACEAEMMRRNAEIKKFTAKKGDVLLWHARLLHRGGTPTQPGAVRKGLIAHYTAAGRLQSWPDPVQHNDAGWYFPLGGIPLDPLEKDDVVHGPCP